MAKTRLLITGLLIIFGILQACSGVTDFCSQPLGMERKIIADSQITQSSVYAANTHEGYQARLNNNQCWCSATAQQSNQWVRVDLKHPMSITGIATQGDPNWPPNFVTKFNLRYSVDGNNYRYKIDNFNHVKELDGATAQNEKKDNLFPSKPFAARYVEFRPTAKDGGGNDICVRFELYGCSYVCDKGFGIESGSTLPTGLTITASHSQSHRLPSHARLNNGASSWCSTSPAANYHLQFDFGRIVTITGIATQGSPVTNDWVKEFYLDYGNTIGSLTHYQEDGTTKVLVGNKDKNTIVVNWFRVRLTARYVRVKPKAWNNWICMRVEIIGCDSEFISELGAENRVLEDSRFSAYAFTPWTSGRYEAKDGRLNNDRPWGRTKTDTNFMWFKVDLGRVMLVNGIATQGDSTYGSNYFPDYKLQYSFDANGAVVVHVKQESSPAVKVFAGNTNNAGVKFNFLKGSQISTRYVQFLKNSNLQNDYTLRVEIYGRPQVCANSFGMVAGEVDTFKPTITVSSGTSADAKINSAVAWCASTLSVNEYFQYDFGIEKTISGIAIQGKPNANEWVKSFKVKYGTQPSSLTTYKEGPSEKTFVGSTSRDLIVYNWFATNLKTRYLRIVPTTWETGICLRVNVYGCPSSGCFDELGIASSIKVPDSDLTSSTAISGNEAKNGRFNADGTWEASGGSKPWIQVCFSSIQKISSVIIQGPGSKDNIAKVTGFSLKYLYSTSGTGYDYRHGGALKIFAGVKGRYESIQVDLPVAVVAKCLRLQVETKSSNINPGLRWELLGCSTVLRVSSVSVSPTTATTARGGKSTVTCTASGQLGMTIEWKKSTVVIQNSGSYVVGGTTISNSDVNGQSTKTLEITANGPFIATTFSTCVVTDASQGLVKCEQDYTCSASYDSISSSISTHTATFEVTGLQAKAAAPTGFTSSGITRTGVTISWNAAIAADFQVQDYRAAIKKKGTSSEIASKTDDGITGTTKTFSGLDVFTEYTVIISARCRKVHVYSDAGTFDVRTEEGASSAPATPTAVSETSRSIKVTWNEPSPLNGILHNYQIQYKKSDASFSPSISVDKHIREKVIDGLDPYTSYEFQVSATTKGGTIQGAWSPSATQRTKEDYPSEPLGLQENNTQARYSVIKWSKPAIENGILRNYTLNFIGRKSYNSTFMHDNVTLLSTSALQYTMTNLVPGTNYTVKIAASTGAGRGNYSQPVVIITLYADPPKPSMTSAVKGGDITEVTLKSASDINGPISKYELIVVNGHTQCASQPSGTPVTVPHVPLILTIEAGIKEVKGFLLNIETVGNFTLCYRAVITSKRSYYSEFTPTHLERKTLEKVNSTLYDSESGATQLVVPLVQGPSGSKFYQVVVYEHTTSSPNRKDPKLYTLNELGPYNAATYKPGTPYITAEISSTPFVSKFSIGDGKDYSRSSRKRRNTEGVKYTNVPLKPNTQYYVFQRAFISDAEFYSSAWSAPLKTKSKTTNGGGGGGGGRIDGGLIAGIVVPIILLIILIPLVILLLRRRKAAPNSKSGDTESKKNLNVMNLKEFEMGSKNEVFEGDEDETLNEKVASSPPQEKPVGIIHRRRSSAAALMHKKPPQSVGHDHRHPAVSIKDFAKHSKQMQKDSHHAITEEYKDLIQGQQYSWSYASRPENKKKNRYANISAYDHSRVKLEEIPGVPFSDYFNANYVNGYTRPSVYIASQGPVDTGLEDFWRMIWDNNVPAIVMVTNVVERGKKKCAQYWPENGTADFGTISVTLMSVDYYVDYAIRAFSVQREGNAEVKYVEQYHFLSWPDMGIPEFPTDLLNLRRKLRRKFPYATKAPILVHCSAGVGRTGTFIVIDAMLELIATQKKVDVFNYVNYIRSQRVHLIQVEEQYIFIYLALLEEATCGNTEIEIQNLRIKINQLQTKDKNEKTGFDQQFQRLALVTPRFTATETSAGLNGSNIEKNRRHDLLPRDLNRVILEQSIYENDGNSDYINATFVNGYKKKNAYIATQHPLHETITDFWNMIYQREVTTIVLLNRLKDGPQTFPVFWPDHESDAKYGHITVSNHYEDKADHFVERSFYVNHRDRSDEYREIEMFHFQHWPDHGVPKDFNKLLSLISKVEKSQQQQNESQPIVIVCSDGAGRSGTFISIAIILERFKTEQLIDVFQTIKKIRAFQPEFVENTVQYKFCHNITQAFIESFDTYANFTG